jgi:hypothetical protein
MTISIFLNWRPRLERRRGISFQLFLQLYQLSSKSTTKARHNGQLSRSRHLASTKTSCTLCFDLLNIGTFDTCGQLLCSDCKVLLQCRSTQDIFDPAQSDRPEKHLNLIESALNPKNAEIACYARPGPNNSENTVCRNATALCMRMDTGWLAQRAPSSISRRLSSLLKPLE